jgi:hypothetical protein
MRRQRLLVRLPRARNASAARRCGVRLRVRLRLRPRRGGIGLPVSLRARERLIREILRAAPSPGVAADAALAGWAAVRDYPVTLDKRPDRLPDLACGDLDASRPAARIPGRASRRRARAAIGTSLHSTSAGHASVAPR